MGIEIDRIRFDAAGRDRFAVRLESQLDQLAELTRRPEFGQGATTMGAELELYVVDEQGTPAPLNKQLKEQAADPQLTLELNRYNLEYNLSPVEFDANGFSAMETEIADKLRALTGIAEAHAARIVPIGILPTLTPSDFGPDWVTDSPRYRALLANLMASRGSDFHIDINGSDPLQLAMSDVTLEGANTSFQIHLKVAPQDYADTFNAIQLATPLAVAIGANSPSVFGHQLWDETRIPLFKQAVDTRQMDRYRWNEPARVAFGHGWARLGAHELFAQAVRLYRPLLPICGPEEQMPPPGMAPTLAELRLHQSTVWQWNRPVYDDVEGGHLRIEMRALPSGPTAIDMVANAAFLVGLGVGLRDDMERLTSSLPFSHAEYNFYRAAQYGLTARPVWPRLRQHGLSEGSVIDVIADVLETSDDGLRSLGVSEQERSRYLGIIDARLVARQTGATWQRDYARKLLTQGMSKPAAMAAVLDRYLLLSASNQPVSEWSLG